MEFFANCILQPVAVIGLILTAIGLIAFGGWYIFVGVGYIFYVAVVLVIESFIMNIYVHRLIVSLACFYNVLHAPFSTIVYTSH